MGTIPLPCAAWTLAAVLACGASLAAADDSTNPLRGSASNGSSAKAAPKTAKKLVPFPEDEQSVPAKPTPPPPRKSTFQPRFKSPAVRQAQHVEPVDAKESPAEQPASATEPAQPDTPDADASAADATEAKPAEGATGEAKPAAGRALADEAFAKSKESVSEGDYTEVIDLCRRAMSDGLDKNYDDYARKLMGWAYNRRGEARAKAGRDQQALADFEAAVEAGGSWRAIHNRGVSYAALGRIKEARADLDRAIELNRSYPNAYFNRGELKYKQGDFPGAIADYNTALELNPKDAVILNSRGHALYRMERFGEALRDYGEAIKNDPENVAALINRGDTHSDLGRYDEAAKDYRAAMRIAPKLSRAYHSAAWFMATCPDANYRNEKLAIEAAKKAIELAGADYRNLSTLAAAQASAGLFAEAKATQEKAIGKAPQRDVVTAEKMMGLYQRDVAFRERPRTAFTPLEELEDAKVQQASGTSAGRDPSARDGAGRWPNRQASGARPPGRPNPRSRY